MKSRDAVTHLVNHYHLQKMVKYGKTMLFVHTPMTMYFLENLRRNKLPPMVRGVGNFVVQRIAQCLQQATTFAFSIFCHDLRSLSVIESRRSLGTSLRQLIQTSRRIQLAENSSNTFCHSSSQPTLHMHSPTIAQVQPYPHVDYWFCACKSCCMLEVN